MTDHLGTMILDSARRFGARPAMRHLEGGSWRSVSYAELGDRVRALSKALVDAGVRAGDRVGIYSANRPEWTVADLSILAVGAVTVPVYATNTARQCEFIVNDAGISLLFVGDQSQYDKVMALRPAVRALTRVVVIDRETRLADSDSEYFEELLSRGASKSDVRLAERMADARSDDVATLIYTSGTTGDPKGAELTHASFFHQFRALDERFGVGPGDSSLCFLPLSHVYERAWSFYVLSRGAENCYVLDPRRVVESMAEVRPNLMVSVPRLFEKIHATVVDRVDRGPAAKAKLFHWAVRVGGTYQHRRAAGEPLGAWLRARHELADRLVLTKIRDVVGGEKKVFSAGGAPLSKEIEEFFFAAGLLVCQGYGLTETTAMLTCNYPGAFRFGTVGTPVLGTEIRVVASGEIQVRGGSVMRGYFGKPEDTEAAFDDGWFKTGDVGTVDADGFLTITDRIKDIIITAQGKNVAPQHVEGVLSADPYIEQVVVVGDRRSYLTALVAPSFELLERFAEEHGIGFTTREELVRAPEVRAFYDARIAEASKELATYEQVKRYTLMPQEFTQESGQMTPTLKLKRRVIEEEYRTLIDAMYGNGPEPAGAR